MNNLFVIKSSTFYKHVDSGDGGYNGGRFVVVVELVVMVVLVVYF